MTSNETFVAVLLLLLNLFKDNNKYIFIMNSLLVKTNKSLLRKITTINYHFIMRLLFVFIFLTPTETFLAVMRLLLNQSTNTNNYTKYIKHSYYKKLIWKVKKKFAIKTFLSSSLKKFWITTRKVKVPWSYNRLSWRCISIKLCLRKTSQRNNIALLT